jgi:hypothetical protein
LGKIHFIMNAIKTLLNDFESIWSIHREVDDTDVREQTYRVVFLGFIDQDPDFTLPDEFGMFEEEGNQGVKEALAKFLPAAVSEAKKLGLRTPEQRFDVFENGRITSDGGKPTDDFFGSSESYEDAKAGFGS